MPEYNVRELVERSVEALGAGDMERFRETLADDATWWILGDVGVSGLKRNPDEIIAFFTYAFTLFAPGLELTVTNIVDGGDSVVVEWHVLAQGATGKTYDNRYCVVYETRDGLIQNAREYLDVKHVHERLLT